MQKLIYIILINIFLVSFSFSQEKELIFSIKSGEFHALSRFDLELNEKHNYRLLFFNDIPKNNEKDYLESIGVEFLEYLPHNKFVVALRKDNIHRDELKRYGAISVLEIKPEYKIDPKIQNQEFPEWALTSGGLLVKVLFYKDINIQDASNALHKFIKSTQLLNDIAFSMEIEIDPLDLFEIAKLDFISFIEPVDPPSIPENKTGRTLHRSNVINTNYATGRHYDGTGINVMMQDDGLVGPHIDRTGRVDQSFCTGCSSSSSNDHGDHVSGTIMGAGNLDPLGKGMAEGSFLYVFGSSNNNYYDVPTIYQNNNVTITSKSYSNGCNAGYTSLARDLDEQINLYPSLIHVFSAGNNGSSDCGYGAGSGWGNVTGGHKQGKNVITVANLTSTSGLSNSSSRGPAHDGRIKPDIGAKGSSVYSPVSPYTYDTYSGTSMACPGISGVLAQLYQAYKELNGGQDPNSALMKCVLLNSADDIGNPGPDFKHGWGEVNAYRAVKILENNQYMSASVSQGQSNSHSIVIPSGVARMNLMVYWHDKEASASASMALVNNLNSTISFLPLGVNYSPWVLDESPNSTSLNLPATTGVDDLNNMEQITVDNPIPGTYTLLVDGFSVPFGPQEYWISYDFFTNDNIELTYPIGGESIVSGQTEIIRWDAFGNTGTFSLEYSIDGGITWGSISNNISGSARHYNWSQTMPTTDNALIKITRNGVSDQSHFPFTVINVPQNISVNWICPDSIYISWSPVIGATDYEISMLGNMYMDSIYTTSNLGAWVINPNPTITDSWFSVCAIINNGKGRRAVAVNAQSISSSCVMPPLAQFSASKTNSCSGIISFLDQSFNGPNSWMWDFGDGNTSNLQNPTHTYLFPGLYDVSLIVSNSLGSDTILINNYINITQSPSPTGINDTICNIGSSASLQSIGNNLIWYDDTTNLSPIGSGSVFATPPLNSTTTFYVREEVGPVSFGGATNNSIGNGDYFYYDQHLIFNAFNSCKIVSAIVYAENNTTITFELRDNNSNVIDDTTINVVAGQQRLYFDFDVPIGNDFELGISAPGNSGLYRNSSGSSYPYLIGNSISITGSSASTAGYYYFFYDIEIQEEPYCNSSFQPVTAHLIPGQGSSLTQNISICYGQTYTLGNNTYSTPGMYIDTIPNAIGCDSIITTNLNVFAQNTNNNDTTICYGDSLIIGNNIYYNTGVYTNILIDQNGCDSILITNLNIVDFPVIVTQNQDTLFAQLGQNNPLYYYQWYLDGISINGSTQNFHIIQSSGIYHLEVTYENCVISSNHLNVIFNNLDEIHGFNLFPNPASNIITIKSTSIISELYLFDISARLVIYESVNNKDYQLDVSKLTEGVYFIELHTSSGVLRKECIIRNEDSY